MSETKINPESLQNRSHYFKSLVNAEFSFLGKTVTEEDSKVKQIICNFLEKNFQCSTQNLCLSYLQTSRFLEISLQLLKNSAFTKSFSKENDYKFLKDQFLKLCSERVLSPRQSLALVKYLDQTYFSHYSLYKYLFINSKDCEVTKRSVSVDSPLPKMPHKQGVRKTPDISHLRLPDSKLPEEPQQLVLEEDPTSSIETAFDQTKNSILNQLAAFETSVKQGVKSIKKK